MKRLLQLMCFTILLTLLLLGNYSNSYANDHGTLLPSENDLIINDMAIDAYDINITVNKDGTLNVEENITVYFLQGEHYFTRTIPLEYNKIHKTTTYSGYANISNIKTNSKCTKEYTTDNYGNTILKLNVKNLDENEACRQNLKLSYTYSLLSRPIEEIDELYFDIIDPFVSTYIGNINFEINMPKKFNKDKIIFTNNSSSSLSDDLNYKVTGNKIKGNYTEILSPETGLTIELDLTKNYFAYKKNLPVFLDLIIIIIALITFIYALSLWLNNNKTIQIAEPLTYFPPNGFNNTEVGLMYKGKSSSADIASLILCLANKGYIAILNNDTSKRHYSFKILKYYNGNNLIEKKFLDGLIKYANKEHIITVHDMKDKFFDIHDDILDILDNGQIRTNMYSKNSKASITILAGMIISLIPLYLIPAIYGVKLNGILPSFAIVGICSLLLIAAKLLIKNSTINAVLNCIIIGFGFLISIATVNLPFGMIYRAKMIYAFIIPISLLLIICSGIILAYTSKRNKYGTVMLNQLNILKNNLLKADKITLISLMQENENYFYNILPYSYTLDFNVQWIKQFENIDVSAPKWYISEKDFDLKTFANGLNRTLNATSEAIDSVPRSIVRNRKK